MADREIKLSTLNIDGVEVPIIIDASVEAARIGMIDAWKFNELLHQWLLESVMLPVELFNDSNSAL